jgi:hypothetical protein
MLRFKEEAQLLRRREVPLLAVAAGGAEALDLRLIETSKIVIAHEHVAEPQFASTFLL